jgi:hypothetical protein
MTPVLNCLSTDDSPFYSSPLSIAAGGSWYGDLLNITINPGTAEGLYEGSFDINGF